MVGMALWWWDELAPQSGHAALAVVLCAAGSRTSSGTLSPRLTFVAIDEEFWRKKEETERFLDPFADSRLTDLLSFSNILIGCLGRGAARGGTPQLRA